MTIAIIQVDGAPFRCPDSRLWLVQSILTGRYGPGDPVAEAGVRRVLDLGAGCGEFALYAAARWQRSWVDCYEPDPELREMLEANGPAGMRVLNDAPTDWKVYDVVRIACEDALLEYADGTPLPGALVVLDYQVRAT